MDIRSSITAQIRDGQKQLAVISKEISSGEKSSYTTAEFRKKLRLDDTIERYSHINSVLDLAKAQNNAADSTLSDMKGVVDSFKTKMIAAGTDTVSDEIRQTIVSDLKNYKDSLIDMANIEVVGEYLFSGDMKSTKPFSYDKDADGHYTNIKYNASNEKFQQIIDKGVTKQQGLTGLNIFDGLVDSDGKQVVDSNGLLATIADGGIADRYFKADGTEVTSENFNTLRSETIYPDNGNGVPDSSEPIIIGDLTLKVMYELDQAIESVANNEVQETLQADGVTKRSIGSMIENVDVNVFDQLNIEHTKLGVSNSMFEKIHEQNATKIFNLNKLSQESFGINIAEETIKMQELQLTFAAIFSTLQQVNSIEQQLMESIF